MPDVWPMGEGRDTAAHHSNSIPQYITVYHSISQYITVYHSISQCITVTGKGISHSILPTTLVTVKYYSILEHTTLLITGLKADGLPSLCIDEKVNDKLSKLLSIQSSKLLSALVTQWGESRVDRKKSHRAGQLLCH